MPLASPLTASALLLLALAPGAQALCTPPACATEALLPHGLSWQVVPTLPPELPDADADDDRYPDAVEAQLCSREAVRAIINDPDVPGHCSTSFEGPFSSIYPGLLDAADADRDSVPDGLEPSLCQVESEGDPSDGECTADNVDYDPPVL